MQSKDKEKAKEPIKVNLTKVTTEQHNKYRCAAYQYIIK